MITLPPVRPHLRPLTALRFFAALLVLGYHASSNISDQAPRWVGDFFGNGYDAVSFFFVLSGFVLTYVYARNGENTALTTDGREFWWARFARIYPAYLLALLISFPTLVYSYLIAHTIPASTFTLSVLTVPALLQAWVPPIALAWNTPAWSLSVEAFFYASFPFLLRRVAGIRPVPLVTLSLCAVILMTVLREWLAASHFLPLASTSRHNLVAYFPLFFLPHFLFGVALSRWFLMEKGLSALASTALFGVAGPVILLLFGSRSNIPAWLLSDAILVPLFGAIIIGAARATGLLAKLFSAHPLVQLGEASYALYILHWPLAFWWQKSERTLGLEPLAYWPSTVLFCLVAISLSCAVNIWIERPLRLRLLQWARSRGPSTQVFPQVLAKPSIRGIAR